MDGERKETDREFRTRMWAEYEAHCEWTRRLHDAPLLTPFGRLVFGFGLAVIIVGLFIGPLVVLFRR